MKRPGAILLTCIGLGVLIVIGAGMQGAARFSGLRWVPDFSPPKQTAFPRPSQLARNTATPLPAAKPHVSATIDVAVIVWVAAGIAALLVLLLVLRWLARRPPRTTEPVDTAAVSDADDRPAAPERAAPSVPVLQRGFRHAIEVFDAAREPHDAIVKAWLGLQDAAADSGIRRRAAETPTEFTKRILGRVPADGGAVDTLLTAYLRVRFGDHPATSADVARVRGALQSLAASWEAADAARRASVPAPPWSRGA